MSRRTRLLSLAAVALAAVAVTAVCRQCRRPDPPSWDWASLAAELRRLGYHVHAEPVDREGPPPPNGVRRPVLAGLYACREEPASWEDLACRARADARLWSGCAVAYPGRVSWRPPAEDREYLSLGPCLLFGDPELLDDIARRLGVPR